MERLERLKDNTVELTEEQKEFDAYDDELLNNILNTPNSTPKSEPKPANKLDDSGNQINNKIIRRKGQRPKKFTRNTTYQKIIKQSPTDTQ